MPAGVLPGHRSAAQRNAANPRPGWVRWRRRHLSRARLDAIGADFVGPNIKDSRRRQRLNCLTPWTTVGLFWEQVLPPGLDRHHHRRFRLRLDERIIRPMETRTTSAFTDAIRPRSRLLAVIGHGSTFLAMLFCCSECCSALACRDLDMSWPLAILPEGTFCVRSHCLLAGTATRKFLPRRQGPPKKKTSRIRSKASLAASRS